MELHFSCKASNFKRSNYLHTGKAEFHLECCLDTSLNPCDWCFFFSFPLTEGIADSSARTTKPAFFTSWGIFFCPLRLSVTSDRNFRLAKVHLRLDPREKSRDWRAGAVRLSGESAPSVVLLSLPSTVLLDRAYGAGQSQPTSKPGAFSVKPGWNFGSALDQPAILQVTRGAWDGCWR